MVRRRSQKAAENDKLVEEAVAGVLSKKYKSRYEAAKRLGVNHTTMYNRLKGKPSRLIACLDQQLLYGHEEIVLTKWIKELTITGYTPNHSLLQEMAEEIHHQHVTSINSLDIVYVSYPPLGGDWVPQFISCHKGLKSVVGCRIESKRMDRATTEALNKWFDVFEKVKTEWKINTENIYNIGETGFLIGRLESTRIIIDSTLQTKYQAQPGWQEWISILECICTNATSITLLVIFKGQNVLSNWIPLYLQNDWYFSANTNGWMSNLHGLEWLKRVFELQTQAKANGCHRMLICDGHDSHISGNFIVCCVWHKIALVIVPSYTSHLLQPQDVTIFGLLKKALMQVLLPLNKAQLACIQKAEWLESYYMAWSESFTAQNIKSAWQGLGLEPFNQHNALQMLLTRSNEAVQPNIPTVTHVFDTVFINSSPLNPTALQNANQVLLAHLECPEPLDTPARSYVRKMAGKTKRLTTRLIVNKRETANLQKVNQKRREHVKGKRAVLQGHHHISTEELHRAVQKAEKEAERRKKTKQKKANQQAEKMSETSSSEEEEVEEEELDEIYDCIIVDSG